MLEIIPSILSSDPNEARSLLSLCQGNVARAHIDIIDGIFANNKTVDPLVFRDVDTSVLLDYHLMVKEPINWIEKCITSHAERIIGQVEMMDNQTKFIETCIENGVKSGLALDLPTQVSALSLDVLSKVDVVLVMSVRAGFGGQEFDESSLPKIEELAEIRDREGFSYKICDDGGVTMDTIALTRGEGIDEVAIGRRLFHGDLVENIDHFQKAAMR